MSAYEKLMVSQNALQKGKYLAIITDCEIKVSKAGNEYLGLKLKTEKGGTLFYNLFNHSEGSLKMLIPQLKKLLLLEKLPLYASVDDILKDKANFLRKIETAINSILKKKIEITVSGHDDDGREKLFISGFMDIPNEAFQTVKTEKPAPVPSFNQKEEFSF